MDYDRAREAITAHPHDRAGAAVGATAIGLQHAKVAVAAAAPSLIWTASAAEAYHATGVDAILCHSKREDDSDIRAFIVEWGTKRCPVVIVPSKNWKVPSSEVAAQGVSTDSLLKDACACISDTVPGGSGHVPTANEGTAVAAATGHHVATGKTSMVRCLPRVKVLYLP